MRLLLVCAALLLSGCAVSVEQRGAPRVYAQALDSETNACIRFPASCPGGAVQDAEALAARQRIAEAGATLGTVAAALRPLDKDHRARIEEAILECVKDADFKLNERYFGGNPTHQQCQEVLGLDARGKPITRAMRLGVEKHELALQCIQQKLQEIRRGGFSLNQRYRENKAAGRWEPLTDEQVQALLRAGGEGLVGTIMPDVIIHTGSLMEVLDVYELKFPCPGANPARWHPYPEGTPHYPLNQGQVYAKAFNGNPARVSPRWGIRRLLEQ